MAEATLRFFDREFDLDIVEIMPDLPYPFPRRSVHESDDYGTRAARWWCRKESA